MMPPEKPKDFKKTMSKLLAYLKPFIPQMTIAILFAIAGTIASVMGPMILGRAVTEIFSGSTRILAGEGGIDFDIVWGVILTLIGLFSLNVCFSMVQGLLMAGVSQRVSYNLRKQFYAKINRMPLKYFDEKPYGEVLSRMTNDIDLMADSLSQNITQITTSIITIIGVLAFMLYISVSMTGLALLIIPLSMVVVGILIKFSQKFFRGQQKYLGTVNGQIEEVFAGHLIVKAFSTEEKERASFEVENNNLYKSAWKAQFVSALMFPAMMFVGNVGYVGVSILGATFAIRGVIQVGDILAFIQYLRRLTDPINMLAQISNVLQSTVAAAERVFEFLEEGEEIPDAKNPADPAIIEGRVVFEGVNFGYEQDKTIIHNFSADIAQGQRTAIVGPTGAGKTTIVKLIMRFYDVNDGAIMLDGHNINDFRRDDLRGMIAMVLQDTWLFNGSIMENIRYGRLNATDDEVIAAAKAAHVDHFINTLPGGYQSEINEEANNISQGQKQLLTIARAILSDPKILILDEATSSVDTRTEILIQKAMDNLMSNRTSFIIAHRLSTIRHADLILVMNNGDIVEQGSHSELLAAGGFYHGLYNSQFEGD
ncbi:MAG: ABC transporter ATP-binding protein/permease [Defluviitaleaceae bacterium]|nr:ABC transporter ATP-binding protein/permease [Defluviitaleaceae bacterium]